MKLKQKIILENTLINNIPCMGFHLIISHNANESEKIQFIYEYKGQKLQNEDDVHLFLQQNKNLNCQKKDFVFKTLYSNLTEQERAILKTPPISKIKSKKLNKYLAALHTLLKYKSKMENAKLKYKHKINTTPNLTLEEKRAKILQYKGKCVACKKKVGIIFINNKTEIQMKCGGGCKLNFTLKKPQIIHIPQRLDFLSKQLEITKQQIIKTKLDLLFELKPEETVAEEFAAFKQKYNTINSEILSLETTLVKQQNIKEKSILLEIENRKLLETVKLYLDNIKEYKITNTKSFLTVAMNIYIKDILPIQENIRKLSYDTMEIEKQKDIITIFRKKFSTRTTELIS